MPIGRHTGPALRTTILTKIRDEGMRVTDAANQYGVHPKTIYGWLDGGTVANSNTSLVLQLNRLKKENEQLLTGCGRRTTGTRSTVLNG